MTRGDGRGVSAVVAFVLLVGVVAVGSIGILVLGGSAVSENQDDAQQQRAEVAVQNLNSEIDSVAREDESSRKVDVDLGSDQGGAVRETDAGRIVVTRTNITAGNTDELVNRSIGAIEYDDGERTYAIQSGGVWRGSGNETQMVSAPPVSYATSRYGTEPTLTIPIVETAGDRRLVDDQVRITHNETISPVNDVTVVEGDLITIRITSEYYVGWGKYYEQITNDAAVEYDHANQTAIVELVVPTVAPPVEGGVIMDGATERLDFKQDAQIDSYNSSAGGYASTSGSGGRVISAGDVRLKQRAKVKGSLEARGGDVRLEQDSRIEGNFMNDSSASLTTHSPLSTHVTGWYNDNASSPTGRTPADSVIDDNYALLNASNDNPSAGNISGRQLQNCDTGPGCRLTSGAYLLDQLYLNGTDELVLDTSGGNIYIVVENEVQLNDSARIRVDGPGQANIYIDSETGSKDFALFQDSEVVVPGERSPQLWVYMDSDAEARFRQRTNFTGVVYGPGPGTQAGAEIDMSTSDEIHVHGAVVGDVAPITQEVKVHYDEALVTETPIKTATTVPRLTFLHVSVYRVDVENAD